MKTILITVTKRLIFSWYFLKDRKVNSSGLKIGGPVQIFFDGNEMSIPCSFHPTLEFRMIFLSPGRAGYVCVEFFEEAIIQVQVILVL